MLYLSFVVISAVLWCFLTFNNPITIEVPVPVSIVGKPDNVRMLANVPDTIVVTVTDRGSEFIKNLFKSSPTIELRFTDFAHDDGSFRVEAPRLKRMIAEKLSKGMLINSIQPDNLNVKYTEGPGKKVPVVVDIEIKSKIDYKQTGPMTQSVDTVEVFSDPETLANITEVYTYHIKALDLTDTLRRKVSIAPLRGAVVEPRSLEVVVPIEKMVPQRQKVQISVRNVPVGVQVIVFPSSVDVTYRAPESATKTSAEVTAVVDYNAIVSSSAKKAEVFIGERPSAFQDFRLSIDSVEYIITKQH